MLRYEGNYNVVCRRRVDGKMTRVNMGTIHARSRKEAKRESIRLFTVDCDTGKPVATMVKADGWFEEFKGYFRRGHHFKQTVSLTAMQREERSFRRASAGTPSVRKDISTSERKTRRSKGKQARQSRRGNR